MIKSVTSKQFQLKYLQHYHFINIYFPVIFKRFFYGQEHQKKIKHYLYKIKDQDNQEHHLSFNFLFHFTIILPHSSYHYFSLSP